MTRADAIKAAQDGTPRLSRREEQLQKRVDELQRVITVRAQTLFGEMVDAINVRKAQALAGDLGARREVQGFVIALNLEALKAAAMGIEVPSQHKDD